jgi:hypothetical protein
MEMDMDIFTTEITVGSPKQIAWAKRLQADLAANIKYRAEIDRLLSMARADEPDLAPMLMAAIEAAAANSSIWIDDVMYAGLEDMLRWAYAAATGDARAKNMTVCRCGYFHTRVAPAMLAAMKEAK